jgi:hypothetical protein
MPSRTGTTAVAGVTRGIASTAHTPPKAHPNTTQRRVWRAVTRVPLTTSSSSSSAAPPVAPAVVCCCGGGGALRRAARAAATYPGSSPPPPAGSVAAKPTAAAWLPARPCASFQPSRARGLGRSRSVNPSARASAAAAPAPIPAASAASAVAVAAPRRRPLLAGEPPATAALAERSSRSIAAGPGASPTECAWRL